MPPHISHIGVHDHGFNNVSMYGTLLSVQAEGRIADEGCERAFYEVALKSSCAVQAAKWTDTRDGSFSHSSSGPHSLFLDTIRTLRTLACVHRLGHALLGENDRKISLLDRLLQHS